MRPAASDLPHRALSPANLDKVLATHKASLTPKRDESIDD
jgi:hypothetical protein